MPEGVRADAPLPSETDLKATQHDDTIPGAEGFVVVPHARRCDVIVHGAAPSSVVVRHGSVGEVLIAVKGGWWGGGSACGVAVRREVVSVGGDVWRKWQAGSSCTSRQR